MTTLVRSATFRRIARDTAAAFVLFFALFALVPACTSSNGARFGDFLSLSAQAGELTKDVVSDLPVTAASLALVATPPQKAGGANVFRRTNHHDAVLLLAAVFSLLAAFNLAFFRHVRRVNASPRRSVWRRD